MYRYIQPRPTYLEGGAFAHIRSGKCICAKNIVNLCLQAQIPFTWSPDLENNTESILISDTEFGVSVQFYSRPQKNAKGKIVEHVWFISENGNDHEMRTYQELENEIHEIENKFHPENEYKNKMPTSRVNKTTPVVSEM